MNRTIIIAVARFALGGCDRPSNSTRPAMLPIMSSALFTVRRRPIRLALDLNRELRTRALATACRFGGLYHS